MGREWDGEGGGINVLVFYVRMRFLRMKDLGVAPYYIREECEECVLCVSYYIQCAANLSKASGSTTKYGSWKTNSSSLKSTPFMFNNRCAPHPHHIVQPTSLNPYIHTYAYTMHTMLCTHASSSLHPPHPQCIAMLHAFHQHASSVQTRIHHGI